MWPIWVCNIAGKLSWKTCHRQAFRCTVCLSSHLLRSNPAFTRRSQQWERMWTEDSNFFFGFDHNWIQLWTTFQLNRMWLKGYTNCLDDGVLNKNTNHRVRLEYNTRNNWGVTYTHQYSLDVISIFKDAVSCKKYISVTVHYQTRSVHSG